MQNNNWLIFYNQIINIKKNKKIYQIKRKAIIKNKRKNK